MMIIKYATTNSGSKMAGCISYNYQEKAVVAETGVSRVVLTKAKAANYIVEKWEKTQTATDTILTCTTWHTS